jgi:hypothetical protein
MTTSSEPTGFDHDVVISMSLTVKPGEGLHECPLATLPTDSEIEVVAFSHKYTAGSHHFLVFSTESRGHPLRDAGDYD